MTEAQSSALDYLAEAARRGDQGPASNIDHPVGLNVPALFDLSGQVAVLTDVGGIGSREIALLLAASGAHVVLADRVAGPAADTAAQIRDQGGIAAALPVDIEQEQAVTNAFAAIPRAAGRFDILVNCAGMGGHQNLLDTSLELWDDIQSLNLKANFLCMREAVRHMAAAQRGGRILNITTIGGHHPTMNGNGVYGAARLGVKALGDSVALDHSRDGVLVNTLMVGMVSNRTSTHPAVAAELAAGRQLSGPIAGPGRVPLGPGTMTDVAGAALFLVSPASRYITGRSLVLDGGFLLT